MDELVVYHDVCGVVIKHGGDVLGTVETETNARRIG